MNSNTFYGWLLFFLVLSLSAKAQIPETGQSANAKGLSVTQLEMILLPGPETTSVGFRIATGYRFESGLSASLGSGFTFYHDPLSLVPVYLQGSYRLNTDNDAVSPFLSLKIGYNLSILTDIDTYVEQHRGGLMLNPSVGIRFPTDHAFGWYLSAGYHFDRSAFSYESWNARTIETHLSHRRFKAGIGIAF